MVRDALIPAAGRGARLDRPQTPKPLVDVGGEPLMLRTLRQLHRAGVRRAVVVVGYEAPRLRRALAHHGIAEMELEIVENPGWEAGLASSLLVARDRFDGPFALAMGDHVFDPPLVSRLLAAEPEPDGVVCLVDPRAEEVHDLEAAVKVRLEGDRVRALGRTLRDFDAVDAGLFLATPALFDALARGGDDLTHGVDRLARAGRARAVSTGEARWDDVDTPAALVHAELRLRQARRVARIDAAPAPPGDYAFHTGRTVRTEVVVERGLAAFPDRAGLVPRESASSPVFVFTDETVNRLYGDRFVGRLAHAGYDVRRVVMADGEASKTLAHYAYLVERVLSQGIDERSVMISLGGGAVCNVCGFIASTLYRGVDLVHVPSTLMAQADAAISHKQGVNGARGKNLVGSYHAPRRIVVDVDLLATLDLRYMRDGMAEVIKHGLAQDAGYATWLDGEHDLRDPDFLEAVVRRNIELKCQLMARDPKELAEGMVLQYGHTVGHPVEYLSGYRLTHGEAVAVGMMASARVARLMGMSDLVATTARILRRFGLPTEIPASLRVADILAAMRYNKRFLVEGTRMALLRGLGELWSVDGEHAIPVSVAVLSRALHEGQRRVETAELESSGLEASA